MSRFLFRCADCALQELAAARICRVMIENMEFTASQSDDSRHWSQATVRGLARRCPRCGEGALFAGYTKTAANCSACGLDFSGHQTDDAPPWLTILIVGHVAIPAALAAKQLLDPPLWLQFAVSAPLIMLATLVVLPLAKGALVGLQWANHMHGFAASDGPKGGISHRPSSPATDPAGRPNPGCLDSPRSMSIYPRLPHDQRLRRISGKVSRGFPTRNARLF